MRKLLLVPLCSILFLTGCLKKPVEIKKIKSFRYSYTTGYAMYSYVVYEINLEDDKYIATIKENGKSDDEAIKIEISEDKVLELENILKDKRVGTWDGFNKSDQDVLDGDSFSLVIYFEDGTSIHASGYMMYPKNYSSFKEACDSYFNEIIK